MVGRKGRLKIDNCWQIFRRRRRDNLHGFLPWNTITPRKIATLTGMIVLLDLSMQTACDRDTDIQCVLFLFRMRMICICVCVCVLLVSLLLFSYCYCCRCWCYLGFFFFFFLCVCVFLFFGGTELCRTHARIWPYFPRICSIVVTGGNVSGCSS